jgi:PTS system glucitol/sorbitol-specific IIC component
LVDGKEESSMQGAFLALLQDQEFVTPGGEGGILGRLGDAGEWFIGLFQAGADTFVGFVTGIIPLVIILLTAFYTIVNLIGEERVQGVARFAAGNMFTRYTLLPMIAVFFLTNPMAYTFGTFLEEKYKPAFYDSAVSFVHPPLGLFPHVNPAEYFVYIGVAAGLQQQDLPLGPFAVRLLLAGIVVILIRGIVTQYITAFLARRQGMEL